MQNKIGVVGMLAGAHVALSLGVTVLLIPILGMNGDQIIVVWLSLMMASTITHFVTVRLHEREAAALPQMSLDGWEILGDDR